MQNIGAGSGNIYSDKLIPNGDGITNEGWED